jgi:S1-C subfamily serine protease
MNQDIPCDAFALCMVRAARGTGSGFAFLKPSWIVTARHVVSGQPPAQPIQLLFRDGGALPARVLFEHPQVDLAVLELVGRSRCGAPLMPGDHAPDTVGLLCVGYKPSVSDRDAGGHAWFASKVNSYERTVRQRDGCEEILFIFPAPFGEPGRSGSPLLAPSGSVIGVVVDGITLGGRQVIRATSIAALHETLTSGGLRWTWRP